MLKSDKLQIRTALSDKISSSEITFAPVDNRRLMDLCGRFDEHIRQIEKKLGVEIHNRGNNFQILGEKEAVEIAKKLLHFLYDQTETNEEITPAKVHFLLQERFQQLNKSQQTHLNEQNEKYAKKKHAEENSIKLPKLHVKPLGKNQVQYINNIFSYDITFGIGPAGTGKTYLAVAAAISALETESVKRIILTRPVVEAGEKLGFLPGDLSQKIDPYLKPLQDALYEMMGFERVIKLIERNIIEIAPLAYMRGRTLNDAFIILDESQNTTREQMKMFLTRLGRHSVTVITGDVTQVDLPSFSVSGLKHAIEILKKVSGISFNYFDSSDVIRHPLVKQIIDAYDTYEKQHPPKGRQ